MMIRSPHRMLDGQGLQGHSHTAWGLDSTETSALSPATSPRRQTLPRSPGAHPWLCLCYDLIISESVPVPLLATEVCWQCRAVRGLRTHHGFLPSSSHGVLPGDTGHGGSGPSMCPPVTWPLLRPLLQIVTVGGTGTQKSMATQRGLFSLGCKGKIKQFLFCDLASRPAAFLTQGNDLWWVRAGPVRALGGGLDPWRVQRSQANGTALCMLQRVWGLWAPPYKPRVKFQHLVQEPSSMSLPSWASWWHLAAAM